ncbi:MAG: DUF962 domain-containing protein [Acidobacteria bacterium]|nr:DUF962 domain-containing protein [Acidobacteriota bacterium]
MDLFSHYDGAHRHPLNRALHLIAIPVGFSSIVVVWFHWIIAFLLIPGAFALAWLGHLIEGNKPAFLTTARRGRSCMDGAKNLWPEAKANRVSPQPDRL